MPNRPDETLAPLLIIKPDVFRYAWSGIDANDWVDEVNAQRRLSAEKDAKLAELQRELDDQNGTTHSLNLAAKVREQAATLSQLVQELARLKAKLNPHA